MTATGIKLSGESLMKATGEVMAIADTFEESLLKAVRGAEIGLDSLDLPRLASKSDEEIEQLLHTVTDERLFVLYEAVKRGIAKAPQQII